MSFPRHDCPLRTDEDFRLKVDHLHHKFNTPLVELPIDMIKDVIIADSLHLIDLGLHLIFIRLLLFTQFVDQFSQVLLENVFMVGLMEAITSERNGLQIKLKISQIS